MASQVSTKVRLVRCPKCREVLAELPDVSLYQCGGCGTVLQAKNRKREANSHGLSSQETDAAAKSRPDEHLEAGSPSQPLTSLHETESLSDKDNSRCNGNSLELCSISPESAPLPDEGSRAESKDFPIRGSMSRIPNSYHGESSLEGSFSDELPSSGEFSLEARVYNMPETGENMKQHEKDRTENDGSERVMPQKGNSLFAEARNMAEHENSSVGRKEGYFQENKASQFISRAKENTSPPPEQIKGDNTNRNGYHSKAASKESLVSFYLTSSDNEHTDHFSRDGRNFRRFSSVDTFGSSSPPMANYPKNGSYYAFEDSESSYDGYYDRFREQNLPRPRKNKVIETRSSELLGKNGFRARNMAELEWGAMRNHHWSQPAETGWLASGNRMRLDGQEGFPRLPFPSSGASAGPGHYRPGSLPPRPDFKPSGPNPDELNLLRTVCELQDQLSRIRFPEIRRFDNFPPEREMYSDAHHPHGYNVGHSRVDVRTGKWDPHYELPQSGCSCPHCLTGPHYSSQLPPADRAQPSISSSSSPARCMAGPEQPSFDDGVGRARLKEKYFAGKRHVRPVVGGAPVVTCYSCLELLRLPEDFPLFDRKKYHFLKCGACRTILRFSISGGTHIVPCGPGATAPPHPAGEADTRGSRGGSFRWAAEPISSSGGYGDGFGRPDDNVPSEGSREKVEDRKMKSVLSGARGEDEPSSSGVGRWRKVGPTSEIEELPTSALHRLMGYSSPSQVLDN